MGLWEKLTVLHSELFPFEEIQVGVLQVSPELLGILAHEFFHLKCVVLHFLQVLLLLIGTDQKTQSLIPKQRGFGLAVNDIMF